MKHSRQSKNRPPTRQERREMRQQKKIVNMIDYDRPKTPIKRKSEIIKPLNTAQKRFDAAIKSSSITFGIGPAGTGKTWFSAMRAAEALDNRLVERIVVTRPAVTADGEDLGFLPGELDEKYEPYLAPVRDALEEKFGTTYLEYLLKCKVIEAIPLGFMRGKTLNNCWVLADEMQNSTKNQMKTLLSRIGEDSKFIINGDPLQLDIPVESSGLIDAVGRLSNVERITSVRFTSSDIVRSGLCQKVVEAYEN